MKWISVKERVPPNDELVLVTFVDEEGATQPELDYRDCCPEYGHAYWANSGEDDVTHWCAIPESPTLNNAR